MIAPYLPELITIASGVGSHTTAAVRLMDFVKNGGKVPVTESTQALGVDGLLSWARVIEQCPGIEAVCCLGLRFLAMCMHVFVLPVIVECCFPYAGPFVFTCYLFLGLGFPHAGSLQLFFV